MTIKELENKVKAEETKTEAPKAAKLIIAIALTPFIYLGHSLVHKYIGKEESEKMITETANLESL